MYPIWLRSYVLCLCPYFKILKTFIYYQVFGRQIIFERSSTATGVYKPAEKVMAGCFPVDAFRVHFSYKFSVQ